MGRRSYRQQRIQQLFKEALELTPEARAQFLENKCEADSGLRTEVKRLLSAAKKGTESTDLNPPSKRPASEIEHFANLAAGTQLGHYVIISKLGSGGMGCVYLAEDTQLRRKVAVKVIAPELARDKRELRRLQHEAQAASALNHPNILTVYEFGHADDMQFIASEFVEGLTLRNKLLAGKPDLNIAIDICIQISNALAAAHERGIVHRDVKPDNVILRSDGLVKVLDFGIAKVGAPRGAETMRKNAFAVTSSISEPGMVLGTAKYMSPEQARGLEVDARSDIFSLGSVMYELVTGREAFGGRTTSDVIAEILKTEPAPPMEFTPDLPYEVQRIITKALRKDRESRYQSVKDLLIDFVAKNNINGDRSKNERIRNSKFERASVPAVVIAPIDPAH